MNRYRWDSLQGNNVTWSSVCSCDFGIDVCATERTRSTFRKYILGNLYDAPCAGKGVKQTAKNLQRQGIRKQIISCIFYSAGLATQMNSFISLHSAARSYIQYTFRWESIFFLLFMHVCISISDKCNKSAAMLAAMRVCVSNGPVRMWVCLSSLWLLECLNEWRSCTKSSKSRQNRDEHLQSRLFEFYSVRQTNNYGILVFCLIP